MSSFWFENSLQALNTLLDFEREVPSLSSPTAEKKDETLVLSWDLPGAIKEQIEIESEGFILIVKGVAGRYKGLQSKVRVNDKHYDMQTLGAELKDGVLTVAIPTGKNVTRNKITIK